jgi:hypothetical protein
MASGRQIADENVERFVTWVASKCEADYRELVTRGVLSRKEIARECGYNLDKALERLLGESHKPPEPQRHFDLGVSVPRWLAAFPRP